VLEVVAVAGLVLVCSTLSGAALWRLTTANAPDTLAPAIGFALLLALAATTIRLPGHALTSIAALLVLVGI
jgi:hypothetical protein